MGFNTGAATVHPTTTATNHDRDTEYDTSTVDIINNDDLKENRDGGDGDYYDNNNNNNNNNIQQKKLLKGDFKEYKGKFASCFKSLEFALIALLTTITMLALVSMAGKYFIHVCLPYFFLFHLFVLVLLYWKLQW